MKITVSPTLVLWANRASKVPFLKAILKPFYYKYKYNIERQRNQLFIQNGINIMKEFDHMMEDNGIRYVMVAGSLLGAVREKGLIRHDLDLDVAVSGSAYKDVYALLTNNGFKLHHSFEVENSTLGREDTFEKDGVTIDIFYIYETEENGMYICDFFAKPGTITWEESMAKYGSVLARRVQIPFSKETVRTAFESIEVNIPKNYDEWLSKRYGRTYMTPDPNWVNGDNPYIVNWPEIKAIYNNY